MSVKVNTKVITGKVRLCYTNLFEPRIMDLNQEPRYSVCILIPKSDKNTLEAIIKGVEGAKLSGAALWGGKIPMDLKLPLRDGDEERGEHEEFTNHYFINAISKERPGVVDRSLRDILEPGVVYSGCYGRVSINFYAFNQGGNKGVGCGLQNVQKLEDGEFLSGRSRAQDDFDMVGDDDNESW
ncbi:MULTISPECIES: DUF2815 family protein [unclassified Clostridium]|uniref:DUF2815 family protein n=1 Tax=unclassified Clostridium TaxID=2614128 RepID=UPI003216D232